MRGHTDIYGHPGRDKPPFVKSDYNDAGDEELTIVSELNVGSHKEIRRFLAPGFTTASVARQERLIYQNVDLFISQLVRFGITESVNMKEVCHRTICATERILL